MYVAGPISTGGDILGNARRGIRAAEDIRKLGFAPFCPHLSVLTEMVVDAVAWNDWLEYDEQVILRCDALFRMEGISRGADREVEFAKANGIPVFHTIGELTDWREAWERKIAS